MQLHRDLFLEMLLTAIWLYDSFPDVDLWVSFSDEPSLCSLDIPILQYTIIDQSVTKAAARSGIGYIDGVSFSINQLLTSGGGQASQHQPAPKFHRGWSMVWPEAWEQLSLLPSALQTYRACVQHKTRGKASIAKLIWRGSNTGRDKGRPPLTGPVATVWENPWGTALLNKRIAVGVTGKYHTDTMDVGLSYIMADWLPEGEGIFCRTIDSSPIVLLVHFIICHSKMCHRPCTSSRHNKREMEQSTCWLWHASMATYRYAYT